MSVSNESPKITDGGEHPDRLSYTQIYQAFEPLNTGKAPADLYDHLATRWSNAASFFAARILQSSSAAWQGNAADASRTAISNYANRAENLTDAIKALHSQTTSAIDGVNGTRNSLDPPIERVSSLNFWDGDFLWHHGNRSKQKIDEQRDNGRAAMKNHYVANFVSADKQIPVTPTPSQIADPLYTYTPTSGSIPGPGHGPSSGGGAGAGLTGGSGTGIGSGADSGPDTQSGASSDSSTSPSSYQPSSTPSSPSTLPSSYTGGLPSNISTTPSSFTGGTGTRHRFGRLRRWRARLTARRRARQERARRHRQNGPQRRGRSRRHPRGRIHHGHDRDGRRRGSEQGQSRERKGP